jgi:hypothetical protein
MHNFIRDALKIVALTIVVLAAGSLLFPWWREEPHKLAGAFAAVALYGILLTAYRQWGKAPGRPKK